MSGSSDQTFSTALGTGSPPAHLIDSFARTSESPNKFSRAALKTGPPPGPAAEMHDSEPLFKIPARTGRTSVAIKDPRTGEPVIFKHQPAESSEVTIDASPHIQGEEEQRVEIDDMFGQRDEEKRVAMKEAVKQRIAELSEERSEPDDEIDIENEPLRALRIIQKKQQEGVISSEDVRGGIVIMRNAAEALEQVKDRLQEQVSVFEHHIGNLRMEAESIERLANAVHDGETVLEHEELIFEEKMKALRATYESEQTELEDAYWKKCQQIESENRDLQDNIEGELAESLKALVLSCGSYLG